MARTQGLGGLTWTLVLGGMMSMTYLKFRQKHKIVDEGSKTSYVDEDGNIIEFLDQGVNNGEGYDPGRDVLRMVKSSLPPWFDLSHVAIGFSAIWGWRAFKAMNRVLVRRYGDINYQIKRPDVLANKIVAMKIFGVGGIIVPAIALGSFWVARGFDSAHLREVVRERPRNLHQQLAMSPLSEFKDNFYANIRKSDQ